MNEKQTVYCSFVFLNAMFEVWQEVWEYDELHKGKPCDKCESVFICMNWVILLFDVRIDGYNLPFVRIWVLENEQLWEKGVASSLFTKFILTSRIYKDINIYVLNIIQYFHFQLSLSVVTLQIIFEPEPITLKNMTDTKRACPKNGIGCPA